MNGARQSVHRDAQVQGSEIVLQSYLSYGAASRSMNSQGAFVSETKFLVENMMRSMARRLEVTMFYGQVGIGTVAADVTAANVITISDAEWASGVWSGAEGAAIDFVAPTLTGAIIASGVIASVDLDTKQITLAANVTVSQDDVIFFSGAYDATPSLLEFAGLHKILSNTGTLFNISAATYALWRSNTVDVGTSAVAPAALSFDKVEEGVARAQAKGLHKAPLMLLVSPIAWKKLLVDQAAKRSYDQNRTSDAEMKDGAESLVFYGQNGKIEIVSSIYVKEGYAYMIPVQEFLRVGSSDMTFERPGAEGKFFRDLEGFAGYELRCYTDQSLFTDKPGLSVLFRYIDPAA